LTKDIANELANNLKELHLPTVRECYEEMAEEARSESMTFEQYLKELIGRECEVRRDNRIVRLLRESKLPMEKTLETFDRTENVLAFGNPGSGKTHLLCAIGQELIHQGRRVLFSPCALLVQRLLIAKRDLKLPYMLKRLARYDVIIIDDIGYVQHSREEMEVLFTLFAERYERGSVMLTSNLPFSKWEQIFKDPMTTAAVIDRLVHHSIIVELNIGSYRLEQSQKRKEGKKVRSMV
jgi:DNA replication protein DnaC